MRVRSTLQTIFDNLGHFCAGGWYISIVVIIAHGGSPLKRWIPIGIVIALVKEFVIDILFEPPAISGEWLGGLVDFAGYFAGAVVSTLLTWWTGWL